jgi:hypothetical protein
MGPEAGRGRTPSRCSERGSSSRLADRLEKVVASLLAAATDFGAEPAVLVMGCVEVALGGTDEAGRRRGFDRRPHKAKIRRSLPCHDPASGVTRVDAVEAQPNHANHLLDIGFAQARVGAGRTASGTVETLVDTAQESVAIKISRLRMQLDDLLKGHRFPSLV